MAHRIAALFLAALAFAGCAEPMPVETRPEREERAATTPPTSPRSPRTAAPPNRGAGAGRVAVVASVTDGDTIRLRDGRRVRLVQIDTPEVSGGAECGGREASAALRSQLRPGTAVRLLAEPSADSVDGYGRLLRYIYRGDTNLNVWMVQRGHAAPYFYDGQRGRFADQLERSARQARARGIGFWGQCPQAILDAYRGVDTGQLSRGSAVTDAAAGAATLQAVAGARASLAPEPPYPPDRDCGDLSGPVRVSAADPHRLDADGDGVGCD